jgi:MFS family permease
VSPAFPDAIRRHVSRHDLDALTCGLRINIFGLGLLGVWTAINTIVLPDRVAATAPGNLAGSALGLVSLLGVGLAAIVQPFAGRASDAAPLPDRRRPFVVAGTILAVPALMLVGWSPTFSLLLAGYVALQLAMNIAQAAFQGFIPDLIDERDRGIASGAKNALTVAGAAIGLVGVRLIQLAGFGAPAVVVFLSVLLGLTALLTVRWVPRIPARPPDERGGGLTTALDPRRVWRTGTRFLREHATFRRAVIAQFLFMLGTNPAQRFLLYFLRDRFGGNAEQRASIGLVAAIVLASVAAVASGAISDRIGRRPVLYASVVLAGLGMAGIGLSPTLALVAAAGAVTATGVGAFQAVNWALLSDQVPSGKEAEAFGIANLSTAGAGAVAGLFGPLVDGLQATLPYGTYLITFVLAGMIVLLACVPVHRMPSTRSGAS